MRSPDCAAWLLVAVLLASTPCARAEIEPASVPIDHLLIVYLENHTFDNLFGLFPGANGITSQNAAVRQVDRDGKPYEWLPQVTIAYPYPPKPDPQFPKQLPNRPFPINRYVPLEQIVEMPVHRFYPNILQINRGKNDKFVPWGDSGALPMGYFDTTKLPLYPYAREFVLADNWFNSSFGGSFLNHFWLVCACTGVFPTAPAKLVARPVLDGAGRVVGLEKDGSVSPDGYAVDHLEPFNPPFQAGTPDGERVPPQTFAAIGDRLSDAGVSWVWYAEGWNDAVAGHPAPSFTPPSSRSATLLGMRPGRRHAPSPEGREESLAVAPRRHPTVGGVVQAARRLQRQRRRGQHARRRATHRRADRGGEGVEAVAANRDRDLLGRLRGLLRPRGAAGDRSLGPREPRADDHHLTVGEALLRGLDPVRDRVDPPVHRVALGPFAPVLARREGGEPPARLRHFTFPPAHGGGSRGRAKG
jgi:hypothetical protein